MAFQSSPRIITTHPLAVLVPELQALVWGHLESESLRNYRILSSHSRAYADQRIETIWAADVGVGRPEDRAPCPADVGAVVAFLRGFLARGGRPSALHLRLPGMAGQPDTCEAYALAVLRTFRAAGATSLRRLVLELPMTGMVAGALTVAAPRLEDMTCLTCIGPDDDQCVAALLEVVGPSLRRLVLTAENTVSEGSSWKATLSAVVQNATVLEAFELREGGLTDELAAQLCRLPRLQSLVVREVQSWGFGDRDVPLRLPPTLRHFRTSTTDQCAAYVSRLEFPPCCTHVELGGLEPLRDPAEELQDVGSVLAKLRHRTKGQHFSLASFELPPPGFAALMPDLGGMELRSLDLRRSMLTPGDLRAAAVHLATVEELTLSIRFLPAAVAPLGKMQNLKCLRLGCDALSRDLVAAWADEVTVCEALEGLLEGPAPLGCLALVQGNETERPLWSIQRDGYPLS